MSQAVAKIKYKINNKLPWVYLKLAVRGAWFILYLTSFWMLGQSVQGQLWNLLRGRLTEAVRGWIYQWIGFFNVHKVSGKPTEWSNSIEELSNQKFNAMDNASMAGGPCWVLLGDTVGWGKLYPSKGSRIMTIWVLGIGFKSCVSKSIGRVVRLYASAK
jgi:hypothetical protein